MTARRCALIDNYRKLAKWALFAGTFLILVYYFLPNTSFISFSPLDRFDLAIVGFQDAIQVAITFFIGLGAGTWLWRLSPTKGQRQLLLLFAIYVALYFVDLTFSLEQPGVILAASQFIIPVTAASVAAVMSPSSPRILLLLYVFSLASSGYALYLFTHGASAIVSGSVLRAGGCYDDPESVAMLSYVGLPISVWLISKSRSSVELLVHIIGLSVIFDTLIVTWDCGDTLAALIGVSYLVCRLMGSGRRWLVVGALSIMTSVTFYVRTTGPLNESYSMASQHSRVLALMKSLSVLRKSWFSGIGVGHIQTPLKQVYHGVTISLNLPEPNSMYLYLLLQLGLGGGVLLICAFIAIGRVVRERETPLCWTILSIWIALMADMVCCLPTILSKLYKQV